MGTYPLFPVSDAGPNTGTPVPATGTHYLRLLANDGDAGYVRFAAGQQEYFALDPSEIPAGDVIDLVVLRGVARDPDVSGDRLRMGIRRSGTTTWLPDFLYDVVGYQPYEPGADFPVDPLDGQPWTKARLAAAAVGVEWTAASGTQPRVTYALAEAHTTEPAPPGPAPGLVLGRPSAAGSEQDWNPNPGGLTLVRSVIDLEGDDEDDSYASSTADGNRMTFLGEQVLRADQVAVVHWVSVRARARRVETGAAGRFRVLVASGAAVTEGPEQLVGSTTYVTYDGSALGWRFEADPATGQRWTPEAALGCEFGVVDSSGAAAHELRCTSLRRQIVLSLRRLNAVRGPL